MYTKLSGVTTFRIVMCHSRARVALQLENCLSILRKSCGEYQTRVIVLKTRLRVREDYTLSVF